MKFLKPCVDCGLLTYTNRCQTHQQKKEQEHNAKRAERKKSTGQYSGNYKARAKAVREAAQVCHLCGGTARLNDSWQADHLIPGDPLSPLAPAHRSCNASRGNKPL